MEWECSCGWNGYKPRSWRGYEKFCPECGSYVKYVSGTKVTKVRCIKTVGNKKNPLFKKGKEYDVTIYKNFMLSAKTEDGEWETIAVNDNACWENDSWFNEHFQIVEFAEVWQNE